MGPSTAAPTTSAQALTNMNNYAGSMKTPDQLLSQEQQSLGTNGAQQQVTGLQTAINNTTNLLNNVAPSVMGRTGNSLVTSAQANAQISNEQAPLSTQLNTEQQGYNTANTNYQNLEQQAENLANSNMTAQQNQEANLNNVYQALYGQEQSTAAQKAQTAQEAQQQQQFDAQMKEQAREFNAGITGGSSVGNILGNLGGNSPTSTTKAPAMTQKNAKNAAAGYDFTDASGNAISAAKYAQLTKTPIGTLLHQMGEKGDAYAMQAYNEISANQAIYAKNPNLLKSEFGALFYGT